MPQWVEFTDDYDHRWPSRAVTEFKAGMIVNVKDEVAKAAFAAEAAKKSSKPDKDAPGYVSSGRKLETDLVAAPEPYIQRRRHVKSNEGTLTGNPNPEEAPVSALPDAADPAALRSEPLIERQVGKAEPVLAITMPVVENAATAQEVPLPGEKTDSQIAAEVGKDQ